MTRRIARRDNPQPKRANKPQVRKVIRRDKEAASERARQLRREDNSLRAIGEVLPLLPTVYDRKGFRLLR
jgi:hypothetical protein